MSAQPKILVVDDEAYVRDSLLEVLRTEGYSATGVGSVAEALAHLDRETVQAVLCDLRLPSGDGHTLLKECKRSELGVPVIMISGAGSIADAVAAMKSGAYDFLQKPIEPAGLLLCLGRALEHHGLVHEVSRLRRAVKQGHAAQILVGSSQAMQRVRGLCQQVAPTDATVLLQGESGTGKELAALEIHRSGPRTERPLLQVNCAAVPEDLFEAEFFGHVRGAFTGAIGDREGWFAEAEGGTLVLDEINSLSLSNQAKLLRVIESRSYQRVGESRLRQADVRLLAISNAPLAELTKAGTFRADLYYRLSVFPIELPPLRLHKEDLFELATHLLLSLRSVALVNPRNAQLAPAALANLAAYDWPGNVRELRNVLERAAILSAGAPLSAELLGSILEPSLALKQHAAEGDLNLRSQLNLAEREVLQRALEKAGGRRKEAAALLGIDAKNLSYYLRKHALAEESP